MDTNIPDVTLKPRIQVRAEGLWGLLEQHYRSTRLEVDSTGFYERVVKPLKEYSFCNPKSLVRPDGSLNDAIVSRLFSETEEPPVPLDLWYVYGSAAFGIECATAAADGDSDLAWDLMAGAWHVLAFALCMGKGEEITLSEVGKHAVSAFSRKGTDKRHANTNAMKDWVYAYIRVDGVQPSQRRAIEIIWPKLKEKFGDDCLASPETTIRGWLLAMPQRENYFLSLQKNL